MATAAEVEGEKAFFLLLRSGKARNWQVRKRLKLEGREELVEMGFEKREEEAKREWEEAIL